MKLHHKAMIDTLTKYGLALLFFWIIITLLPLSSQAGNNEMVQKWKAEGWQTDFSRSNIPFSEIMSGGPLRDGIPPIDSPRFISLKELGNRIPKGEPVLGLTLNGDARAYPLRVLMWHEIVNDVVGGEPVTITYCPLCNSGIVFKRKFQGKLLDFGTSGKLRNSDLVMYDRQTQSWWQQFSGEGIIGHYTGKTLERIPVRLESLALFRKRNPKGRVLIPNRPGSRDYGQNPYAGYDRSPAPFLYQGEMPKGIEPMLRVVTFTGTSGKPHAVTLSLLRRKKSMTLGGITLTWQSGQNSALDHAFINKGRDVGNVTAYRSNKGIRKDIAYEVTFAFVFHAFHKDRPIMTK